MIDYRDARPSDGPALADMAAQSFRDTFAHLYTPATLDGFLAETFGPAGLPAQIGDPAYRIRVAVDGERIAGFAKLGPCGLPTPPVPPAAAELKQLYCDTAYHGRGIAQALMGWVLDTVRADGASHLVLSVFAENIRAQRFYARYGLAEIGAHPFRVGDQLDDDRIWSVAL
jgi:ribosomal protein S18 acetylase RimI-like enzyme